MISVRPRVCRTILPDDVAILTWRMISRMNWIAWTMGAPAADAFLERRGRVDLAVVAHDRIDRGPLDVDVAEVRAPSHEVGDGLGQDVLGQDEGGRSRRGPSGT